MGFIRIMEKQQIAEAFKTLQDRICAALEAEDGKAKFQEDIWEHHTGGGGRTRLIQDGNVLEKGGVNFSAVEGPVHPRLRAQMNLPEGEEITFFATGVSIVQHPNNPKVPIIHMNVRYFEMSNGVCWFGGGIDLTPHYVVPEQATYFHQQMKAVCDHHHPAFYQKFKAWADDYFYLPHREETRGVGGIFFDYLKPNDSSHGLSKQALLDFVLGVGNTFAPVYTHLMHSNKGETFTPEEKQWQYLRRGRYVEFNLVWDRGTKFGLETGGRTESILMSLPPQANWAYDYTPPADSAESETLKMLKKGIDWVS
jgi:coproporphyrinogen III oxidase